MIRAGEIWMRDMKTLVSRLGRWSIRQYGVRRLGRHPRPTRRKLEEKGEADRDLSDCC